MHLLIGQTQSSTSAHGMGRECMLKTPVCCCILICCAALNCSGLIFATEQKRCHFRGCKMATHFLFTVGYMFCYPNLLCEENRTTPWLRSLSYVTLHSDVHLNNPIFKLQ